MDVFAATEKLSPPDVCLQGLQYAQKHGHDVVILDTAGRLHVDEDLMQEVQQVHAVTQPHAVLLVNDAMLGQDAVNSAKEFHWLSCAAHSIHLSSQHSSSTWVTLGTWAGDAPGV